MTPRERFIQTLTFGTPDRVYLSGVYGNYVRPSTLDAWLLQGLPQECSDMAVWNAFVGNDPFLHRSPVSASPYPAFEVEIIEETAGGRIWRDADGIVMHDAGAQLYTPGFLTRSYVSHPVNHRKDWEQFSLRLDPHTPERFPADWESQVSALRGHDAPLVLSIPGLYWKARDYLGFEHLSMMFYDDPALVHDIMEHLTLFIIEIYNRILREVEVDCVMLSEDMAYKHAAMISPAMFREFMLPRYRRLIAFFKSHHVPVVAVDSDGHVGQLLPLWIEAGFDATFPIEAAALNDVIAYRQQYDKQLGFWGCIDKRELRSKEQTFIEVMRKVPWLIEQGGYLPAVDHAVPPDVPLRTYLYFMELLRAITTGSPVPAPDTPLAIEERLGPIERMWQPEDCATQQDTEEF